MGGCCCGNCGNCKCNIDFDSENITRNCNILMKEVSREDCCTQWIYKTPMSASPDNVCNYHDLCPNEVYCDNAR